MFERVLERIPAVKAFNGESGIPLFKKCKSLAFNVLTGETRISSLARVDVIAYRLLRHLLPQFLGEVGQLCC